MAKHWSNLTEAEYERLAVWSPRPWERLCCPRCDKDMSKEIFDVFNGSYQWLELTCHDCTSNENETWGFKVNYLGNIYETFGVN